MRNLILTLSLCFFSTTAFAHPGGHSLVCKSLPNAKRKLELSLARSNGTGWYPPSFSIAVDGKKHEFTTDDEMKTFGSTFHNSPLGVIVVTADNSGDDQDGTRFGYFQVVGIPSTVKAYDPQGKRIKWSPELEKDACVDANGKATFKGMIRVEFREGQDSFELEGEPMNCELTYNSGMAC